MELEQFYDKYVDKVYKFFYVKCLNRSIAEDLTSQTFVNFIEQRQRGTQMQDSKKYLYGIMRNTWAGFLRERYQAALEYVENIEDFEIYSHSQIEQFESHEPHNRVLPFIDQLPEKQKLVLSLKLLEERTNKQIANELGKDVNYVKTTYRRAVDRLREMLKTPYLFEGEAIEK